MFTYSYKVIDVYFIFFNNGMWGNVGGIIMKLTTKKWILTLLVIIPALLDTISFLVPQLFEFEANPIYLLTGSVTLVVGLKWLILSLIVFLIWKYKPQKSYVYAYGLCFMVIYLAVIQSLGTYSNLNVSHEVATSEPGTVVPLEKKEAMTTYFNYQIFLFYIPVALAIISFKIFEWVYLVLPPPPIPPHR